MTDDWEADDRTQNEALLIGHKTQSRKNSTPNCYGNKRQRPLVVWLSFWPVLSEKPNKKSVSYANETAGAGYDKHPNASFSNPVSLSALATCVVQNQLTLNDLLMTSDGGCYLTSHTEDR